MEQSSFIKINPADSVVVCLRPFTKGETIEVDGKSVTLLQDTPLSTMLRKDRTSSNTVIPLVMHGKT